MYMSRWIVSIDTSLDKAWVANYPDGRLYLLQGYSLGC